MNKFKVMVLLALVCPLMRGSTAESSETSEVVKKQIVKGKDRPLTILLNIKQHVSVDMQLVETLIEAKADISSPDSAGYHPIISVARHNNLRGVQLLVKHCANVNVGSLKEGWTPLICAAVTSNLDMVQFLLDHGAQVNDQDLNGLTALGHCVQWPCNNQEDNQRKSICVNLLLKNGAWVDGQEPAQSKEIVISAPAKGMQLSSAKKGLPNAPTDFIED